MTLAILAVYLLAWANGANDISRAVATLVGNGITHARCAVLWGTFWTMLGGHMGRSVDGCTLDRSHQTQSK